MTTTAKNTLVLYVEDEPGVLARVTLLFRRRAFNIASLTVGRTETPGISRMTVVVETDAAGMHRLESHLYKLVNLIRMQNVTDVPAIYHDLAIIKVAAGETVRPQVLRIVEEFHARVLDFAPSSLIIEISGKEEEIDSFVAALRPFGVLEMARTGRVAMACGPAPQTGETVKASVGGHEGASAESV